MLDFTDIQKVVGIFRDESRVFVTTIMHGCADMLKQRMFPVEMNLRTQHLALDTIRELLIEKKVCTLEEFNDRFKGNDFIMATKEKEIQEKIDKANKLAKPTGEDKRIINSARN